jgi:hypothetical protein
MTSQPTSWRADANTARQSSAMSRQAGHPLVAPFLGRHDIGQRVRGPRRAYQRRTWLNPQVSGSTAWKRIGGMP